MDFETLKHDYEWGWLDKESLKEFITYGVITQEQYNSIINPVTPKSIINDKHIKENSIDPIQSIPNNQVESSNASTGTIKNVEPIIVDTKAQSPLGFLN